MANLQKQIEILNKEISSQIPEEILLAFSDSINDLKRKIIEDDCITKTMPPFKLKSTDGIIVNLDDLLVEYDKVVIAFFRGSWCPYCNLELRALQNSLRQIETNNIKLIAITPQKIEYSSSMKEKDAITFQILFDEHNLLAKQLGISFSLQDFVIPCYQQLGIDLKEFNGNDDNSLPIPAVYVVGKDHNITYSFVDVNYMNRVNIEELIIHLRNSNK